MVFGISNTPSIQPEQVEDYIENGHQLIDVREDDEWQAGHHLNANHIKMGEIPSNLDKFDKEKKYIIVCRSGGRSAKVTDFLVENEIDALNLTDKIMFITKIDGVEKVVFFQNSNLDIEQKKNFLAEPRFNLNLKNNNIIDIKTLNPKINFNYLGAILRSAQMIGSMEKILNLSIDYCSQRKQFGRALSKFQAIQHQISEMAVELSASSAALSTIASSEDLSKNIYDIAILKIRTGIAAGKIIAISHQVHGAIGFTKEYELAYFTKNLNSWRNDFGNESYWDEFLGKDFLENSNKNLWEYLTY